MSKTAKIIIALIVVVLVIWVIASGKKSNTSSEEPIRIGFIDPLSGGAVNFGESTKGGYSLAVKEINDKGGIDGRKIELIYEDGKCAGKDSATAAQKLISIDNVKYIVGMICSGEVLSVAPISEQNKVLLFVHGSSPDITNAGQYILRTSPSDLLSAKKIAEHAIANKFLNVAVIVENTDYSTALKKAFDNVYSELGGKIVSSESYPAGTSDFRSILTKISASKPDALFIDAQDGVNAARIAEQARDMGISAQFYGAFFTGPEYVKSSAAEGTYVVDVPGLDKTSKSASEFLQKYVAYNGGTPAYPFFAAAAYDQMNVLAEAISEKGYDDTTAVRDIIQDNKSHEGVIGRFSFDNNGDVDGISLRVVKIIKNEAVELK